jgi:hypothetical protein
MFSGGKWHLELIISLLYVLKNAFGEVNEAMFLGVDRPCELILCYLGIEKTIWAIRLSDVLSIRMARWTHNLPSGRLKKRLWWRLIELSRCRKPMRTHFLNRGYKKNRLGQISLRNVFCTRMALRTHNLTSGRLKNQVSWFRWSDFSRCWEAIRTHFVFHGHRKKQLGRSLLIMI